MKPAHGDGIKDFVLSFRQVAPALVWYRRAARGWDRYVIEREFLTVEAGGASSDIDGDGDLDILNKLREKTPVKAMRARRHRLA